MPGRARILMLAAIAASAVTLGNPTVALAVPPPSVPNSVASNNCVATTSGVLFFREKGEKLGKDVSQFAANPPGGQASFVQGQLAKQGADCFGS